jgi:S-DNA-T family DNA segregation ATPase FtsK/SpoIIIE
LPAAIRDALARRLRELAGLSLIALSGVAAAALMTWSVQDPSLSHATSRAIRNVVGYPGAIGADLLMQILGLGAIMLILPVAVWGWRMLTHRTFDREALRLGCWILCTVIAAGFASCWPHGGAWPLPTGLGGVVGDALVRAPAVVFGPAGFVYRLVLGMILFAAMCVTFLFASGWGSRAREELTEIEDDDAPFGEEDDRSSVSLGWVFHALMSTKARLAWLLSTAYLLLRPAGAKSRRPYRAIIGPAGRIRGRRRRRRRGRRRPGSSRPAQEGSAACAGAQIVGQVRTACGIDAHRAQGFGPAAAQQG